MSLADRIDALFPRAEDIPEAFRIPAPLEQREYLVNGEIRTWDGPLGPVRSPVCLVANGRAAPVTIGACPELTPTEALDALAAACAAYDHGRGAWPTMSVADRIRHVEDFALRMQEKRDEVVKLIVWEIAKPVQDARKEFDRTVEYILDTVSALKDLDRVSSRFEIREQIYAQIRRAPLGVVLCMGPYNYPLNETFTTLIPALIMGNTVLFKPPKLGVLLHRPLLEALRDAFPPGVVNTVYGEGATVVGPLMESGRIDCLAFIGSCRVADILKHQHPQPHRLRSVLGLGAKNAGIILPDADLDQAAAECALGAFSYSGQRCTALKILFAHERVAEAFCARFVERVQALSFGMPWEEGVKITPLPVPDKPAYLTRCVEEAAAQGARVLNECGGRCNQTYFHPAVLFPVQPGSEIYAHEQFGPLAPIATFRDIREPIEYVVNSPYGQQCAVFGQDPQALARLIDPLVNQVCRVNLNSQCQRGPDAFPFTGRKDSAEGTLSVSDALRVFSIRTLVAAKGTPLNKQVLAAICRERRSNFVSTEFIF